MRRVLVAVSVIVGAAALVVGILAWMGRGPFTEEPKRLTFSPTAVRTLGQGGDPLAVYVTFPWSRDGYCAGQFTVSARESESSVMLSQVTGFEWPPGELCPGVGSEDGYAAAELMLQRPLGTRAVTRAVDGAAVPVLDPCERQGMPAWCPRPR